MKLNDLKPADGSKKDRKRVGRGPGAGQGKTAGRGTKGQGSRSGGSTRLYHQGGNLPFYRRLPFMRGEGFSALNSVDYNEINLDQLQEQFPQGGLITPELLGTTNLVRDEHKPIVILARGEVTKALQVRIHRISASAKAKIEAAGGSVELVEFK